MSHAERENLSALVDGELQPDQVRFLLRRAAGSASLCATWSRYHLMGDGIRHEVCVLADAGFADRVMHAIATDADVADARPAHSSRRGHHWLRWSAGGAIAAGVAAVALVMVQPQMSAPVAAPAGSRLAATQPAAPRATPMAAPAVPRWLSASPSAAQLAQPAAADFSGAGRITPMPGYAQHLNPYMTLPGYRTPAARDARRVMHELWSMGVRPAPPSTLLRAQTR